jgi:hypothetical protein
MNDIANDKLNRVSTQFLIPDVDAFAALTASVTTAPKYLEQIGRSFSFNIAAASRVASIPFIMAHASEMQQHFYSTLTAERIRIPNFTAEQIGGHSEPEKAAQINAKQKLKTFQETASGKKAIISGVLDRLDASLNDDDFKKAAQDLLSEALVNIWGCFEVFVSDTTITIVNHNPKFAVDLADDASTKKYLQPVSLDSLSKFQFDASGSMGNIIFGDHIDRFVTIKAVLSVLFPDDSSLREQFSDTDLWVLSQRRHLIAHKRGIVDEEYLEKTPDKVPLFSRLNVGGFIIDKSLSVVCKAAIALIEATKRAKYLNT